MPHPVVRFNTSINPKMPGVRSPLASSSAHHPHHASLTLESMALELQGPGVFGHRTHNVVRYSGRNDRFNV
jgi:hypothetical protein